MLINSITLIIALFHLLYAHDCQISTWARGAKGAVSITWDDNVATQFTTVVPLMNTYGIQGTFFIVTNTVNNWNTIRTVAAAGHEIASHSITHARFNDLDSTGLEHELHYSQFLIDSQIPSKKCLTHAYPFCQYEKAQHIACKYYIAARGCGAGMALDTGKTIEEATPENLFNVLATHMDRKGQKATSGMMNQYIDKLLDEGGWFVELFHGCDSSGYMWIYADTLEQHFSYLAQKADKLYIAPFGEVARYIKERNCASCSTIEENRQKITLSVLDTLSNDTVYNKELTAKIALPQSWNSAVVVQNGDTMWSQIRGDTLMFEAIPDGPDVEIIKSPSGIASYSQTVRSFSIIYAPHPSRLSLQIPEGSAQSFSITNVNGKKIMQFYPEPENSHGSVEICFPHHASAGLYLFIIRAEGKEFIHKFAVPR